MIKQLLLPAVLLLACGTATAQRWAIAPGEHRIVWTPDAASLPHNDHIEMSGEQMAFVLRWSVDDDGSFRGERSLVFPMLRTVPNNTHASLMYRMATDIPSLLGVNGLVLQNECVDSLTIDGALTVRSRWAIGVMNIGAARDRRPTPCIEMTRRIFPSRTLPLMCERYTLRNIGTSPLSISIPELSQVVTTDPAKGVDGAYVIRCDLTGAGTRSLQPADSLCFDVVFQACRATEEPLRPDVAAEYASRMEFVREVIDANLVLETPDEVLDTEFRYAKLRASESIFKTRGGYMHAPGGESYYAAIWTNDQAEYVNPFFPFLGYGVGNASAVNAYRHFARFMNDEYKPLPSSIIAEGLDFWDGAGDRGDAAMVAYGAARYALARGDVSEARELWPLIEWCLEYCRRQLTPEGVVASDSDELEGRFPSGDANLCTSTLYYDALRSAAFLGRDLGVAASQTRRYTREADALARAIERHFAAEVSGYATYRYYEGNTTLRSWICMPLIVGLYDRAEGTVAALLGPELRTEDGLLTEQGSTTFWDRATLYALRGVFQAGYTEQALEWLHHYSSRRLLGDHVPYPIEAWPEGSQRHLSPESGLYCRIMTEGLFGIRPTGLRSFDMTPRLPAQWPRMALRRVQAFGTTFDIEVERLDDGRLSVTVDYDGHRIERVIASGKSLSVRLS
ncbi:hypothetical protein [uncultured Alistipes sp.]|uniref:hypothetical protein n=1 Tax=uncultured Alistipes sp. TaxID=538949 RepID=UPI002639F7C6|nr:hypothetical protein [uncultured Alistipes sp.]